LAILGFMGVTTSGPDSWFPIPVVPASNMANASRNAAEAAIGVISAPSASFIRLMARACNCDTRDSLTPSSAPMSFMVTSL